MTYIEDFEKNLKIAKQQIDASVDAYKNIVSSKKSTRSSLWNKFIKSQKQEAVEIWKNIKKE